MADWLKEQGHELIVTSSKEGPDSDFQKHIKDVSRPEVATGVSRLTTATCRPRS